MTLIIDRNAIETYMLEYRARHVAKSLFIRRLLFLLRDRQLNESLFFTVVKKRKEKKKKRAFGLFDGIR